MLITGIIVLFMVFALFWKSGLRSKSEPMGDPFDLLTTNTIKGICALVVVMVHFPMEFSNPFQDAIGSFAYVAVTFFFFVSAYGMQYALTYRQNYFHKYWLNRLTTLLIPMVMVNIVSFLLFLVDRSGISSRYALLYHFNEYVFVLLEYCFLFYVCNRIGRRFSLSQSWINVMLISWVIISSLVLYLTTPADAVKMGWPYERFGLIWGLLAFSYRENLIRWMRRANISKLIVLVLLSGILGVAYLKYKSIFFFGEYLLKIVLGLSLIITIFLTVSIIRVGNPVSRLLGKISYVVYLIHGNIMRIIAYLIPEANSGEMILMTYVVVIAISVPLTYLSTRIADRIRAALTQVSV